MKCEVEYLNQRINNLNHIKSSELSNNLNYIKSSELSNNLNYIESSELSSNLNYIKSSELSSNLNNVESSELSNNLNNVESSELSKDIEEISLEKEIIELKLIYQIMLIILILILFNLIIWLIQSKNKNSVSEKYIYSNQNEITLNTNEDKEQILTETYNLNMTFNMEEYLFKIIITFDQSNKNNQFIKIIKNKENKNIINNINYNTNNITFDIKMKDINNFFKIIKNNKFITNNWKKIDDIEKDKKFNMTKEYNILKKIEFSVTNDTKKKNNNPCNTNTYQIYLKSKNNYYNLINEEQKEYNYYIVYNLSDTQGFTFYITNEAQKI